jgi:hypothetical protein
MKSLPVFLVIVVLSVGTVHADQDVYLYSPEVADLIDVQHYIVSGHIFWLMGVGSMRYVEPGPAPAPYPEIVLWEPDIERLGASGDEMDGIRFINHGTHWVKDRLALVLWRIDIPEASARLASDFAENLSVCLWVDWNQDQMWNKNEAMIRRHLNLSQHIPFVHPTLHVYFLTAFRVPDLDLVAALKKKHGDNEILDLWVRGVVAYDDPDMSPDGEQLFGDVEDYMVKYMKQKPKDKWDKKD